MELLSDRTNIIIMADEAHRSQYDMLDGFAAHLNDAFQTLHSSVSLELQLPLKIEIPGRCLVKTSVSTI